MYDVSVESTRGTVSLLFLSPLTSSSSGSDRMSNFAEGGSPAVQLWLPFDDPSHLLLAHFFISDWSQVFPIHFTSKKIAFSNEKLVPGTTGVHKIRHWSIQLLVVFRDKKSVAIYTIK